MGGTWEEYGRNIPPMCGWDFFVFGCKFFRRTRMQDKVLVVYVWSSPDKNDIPYFLRASLTDNFALEN